MKKYLFLIVLFFVYLILSHSNKSAKVLLYSDINNDSVMNLNLRFDNGINSNELIRFFDKYNYEYYVYSIKTLNKKENVSCSKITKCIDEIYKIEDNYFVSKYITTGFMIKELNLLSYSDYIIPFLDNNNVSYEIIKNSTT